MMLLAVVAVAVAGGGLTWWLLSIAAADPSPSASVQIDAIRTGLSAAVGTGGAFALLLAFRRQRSTEVSAVHTITDATERRVTERIPRPPTSSAATRPQSGWLAGAPGPAVVDRETRGR
jgi:hypothetical protein